MKERRSGTPGETFVWLLLVTLSIAFLASMVVAFVPWEYGPNRLYLFNAIFPVFALIASMFATWFILTARGRSPSDPARAARAAEGATPAVQAMRPFAATTAQVVTETADGSVKVEQLATRALQSEDGRLVVLDPAGRARYVLHDAGLWEALAKERERAEALTLADYLDGADRRSRAAAFVIVGPEMPLEEVAGRMLAGPDCQNAIVTTDGSEKGRALGLITEAALTQLLLPAHGTRAANGRPD